MFENFKAVEVQVRETSIFVRWSGSGPPILLLHGFPQTHLMWRAVAPMLARDFTVLCADLRGYGRSGCPPSTVAITELVVPRSMPTVFAMFSTPCR